MQFDLLIRHGEVWDGLGSSPARADVGVRGGRIEEVGDLSAATAGQDLDARGLAVAPGFIDTHTHSDMVWGLGAEHQDLAAGTVRQGVTTEVCGNCGFTPYPCVPERRDDLTRHAGILGGAALDWLDLAGWAERATARGHFANLAPLVGHGSVRVGVMGFDDRPPRDDELATMRRLVEDAFEQGAFGLSTGLIYMPGVYARTDELIALARTVAGYGRPYISHIRGESGTVADAVQEAIRIGREAGLPAHVSHHKAAGRANWGRTEETLGIIERARGEGTDVTVDVYPYTAGSTLLHALLPAWAQEGGTERIVERLAGGESRRRIADEVAAGFQDANGLGLGGWGDVGISSCPEHPEYEGRRVPELAEAAGARADDFVFDLLIAERCRATMITYSMSEPDVRRVLAYPGATIGSDGIPLPGKPHPRWAGTFARVLGHYGRDEHVLELAAAIRKATSAAAERFGLRDRGSVQPGKAADLVVFDPATIVDRSTYQDPLRRPAGVRDVVVAGRPVVRDGELTGERPGVVLRP